MATRKLPSQLELVLRSASEVLAHLEKEWALVGGLAVSARAEPRFTRDADLAVAVDDDAEAEALVRSLQALGYRARDVVEQETTGRLATVRLLPTEGDGEGIVLDLLFASSGIEAEIASSATTLEVFPQLRLPVAQLGHLLALKILARDDDTRPQDVIDIRAMLAVANEADLCLARSALQEIEDRGFHRNRDLPVRLAEVL